MGAEAQTWAASDIPKASEFTDASASITQPYPKSSTRPRFDAPALIALAAATVFSVAATAHTAPRDIRASQTAIVHCRRRQVSQQITSTLHRIVDLLAYEGVQLGYSHPSEEPLRQIFEQDAAGVASLLSDLILAKGVGSDLLRLLGRLPLESINLAEAEWRQRVLARSLISKDTGLREAAIEAIENWRDAFGIGLLSSHHDPKPWLEKYARQVVKEAAIISEGA